MSQYLLAYYLVFFGLVFALPTWRLWKAEGINALVLPQDDSAYGLIGRIFKAIIACVFLFLLALAIGVDLKIFGLFYWLQIEAARTIGYALLGGSTFLIGLAQYHMGKSWRIGIDEAVKTVLVTSGLYAKSRNPIFLGMRLNLLGLFLILPCAATSAIFLLSEALISVQVRLEEAHLIESNSVDYADYFARTPRWL